MKNIEQPHTPEQPRSISDLLQQHARESLRKLFPDKDVDRVVDPFISDVLSDGGIDSGAVFHRLSETKQSVSLIALGSEGNVLTEEDLDRATDPLNEGIDYESIEKVLRHLFDDVPDELVSFYEKKIVEPPKKDLLDESEDADLS